METADAKIDKDTTSRRDASTGLLKPLAPAVWGDKATGEIADEVRSAFDGSNTQRLDLLEAAPLSAEEPAEEPLELPALDDNEADDDEALAAELGPVRRRNAPIVFDQVNRKSKKSWAKYERYKTATTIGEFYDLGGTRADLYWDYVRNYWRTTSDIEAARLMHGLHPVLLADDFRFSTTNFDGTETDVDFTSRSDHVAILGVPDDHDLFGAHARIHARHQATEEEIKCHDNFIGTTTLSTSLGDDHDNVPRAHVLDIHTALNASLHQASIFSVYSLDDPTFVDHDDLQDAIMDYIERKITELDNREASIAAALEVEDHVRRTERTLAPSTIPLFDIQRHNSGNIFDDIFSIDDDHGSAPSTTSTDTLDTDTSLAHLLLAAQRDGLEFAYNLQDTPTDMGTAMKDPAWQASVIEEYFSLVNMRSWTYHPFSEVPFGELPLPCKAVFKIKSTGRLKTRITAGGHRQREHVDYWEKYASVVSAESLRTLIERRAQRLLDVRPSRRRATLDGTAVPSYCDRASRRNR